MASPMPAVVGRRRVLLRGAALFAFVAALVQLLRAFLSKRRLPAVRERHSFSPAEDGDGEPALICAMTSPPATSLSPPPQTPPDSLQPKHDQSDSSADVVSLLAAEVAALREQLAAAEGERAAAEKERAVAVAALERRETLVEWDQEGSEAEGEAEEAAGEAGEVEEVAEAEASSPSFDSRYKRLRKDMLKFGAPLNAITSGDQSWPPSLSSSICADYPSPPPSPLLPLQTIRNGIDGLRIHVHSANDADDVGPKSLGSLCSLDTPCSVTHAQDHSMDTCVCGSGYRLPVGCIRGMDTCVCGLISMPSSPPAASADIGTGTAVEPTSPPADIRAMQMLRRRFTPLGPHVLASPAGSRRCDAAEDGTAEDSPPADTPRQRRTAVNRPVMRGRADQEV